MEVGQGPNVGCSTKGKKSIIYERNLQKIELNKKVSPFLVKVNRAELFHYTSYNFTHFRILTICTYSLHTFH
jgi:hypothetical protein